MDWGGSLVDGGASGTSAQQDQQTQTSGISNGASDWNIFSDFYDDDDDDHDDDHDDDDDDHDDDDHDDDDDDHDDDDD